MNALDAIRARNAAIARAEARAVATADTLSSDLAYAAAHPAPPRPAPVAINRLALMQRIANSPVGDQLKETSLAEVYRITKLPIVLPMDARELEEFNRLNVLADVFETRLDKATGEIIKGFRLFPLQAEAICAYELYGCLFGPIGVGWGKTLITLAIASKAYVKGLRRLMLLVPPNVIPQLWGHDIKWARTRIPLNLPIHLVAGKSRKERKLLSESGKKGLYIMPYSYLSVADTSEMLEAISPELIICDECHNLANRSSARTKRIMHYVERHKPQGVGLSGTITSKSIRDYYHLAKWCLRDYNFLPNALNLATEWASVIDAQATGTYGEDSPTRTASSPLVPLIRWAQQNFKEEKWGEDVRSFRRAYKLRMTTAPGVVSSGDASIGTSLSIANRPVADCEKSEHWTELQRLTDRVTDEWITPAGDEIEHAIHTWRYLYELSAGFYNKLTWPERPVYAKRKQIAEDEAARQLELAQKCHAANQCYARALRKWLENKSRPGIDTPLLVGQEMSRNGAKTVGQDLYDLWRDWKLQEFPGMPERDSSAVRVCPYKIDAAVAWALALAEADPGKGALFWVWHQEIGEWLYEKLVLAGLDALHCPAGDAYNEKIIDHANSGKFTVASIEAHGTGKNLQHFEYNYFMQWPRSPIKAEQTMGRTHRSGQKADELTMTLNNTGEFDALNFAATLNDSLYIHQSTGNRQKLIYANYDPLPKVFPSAVLIERGAQARMLTGEQQRELRERFTE